MTKQLSIGGNIKLNWTWIWIFLLRSVLTSVTLSEHKIPATFSYHDFARLQVVGPSFFGPWTTLLSQRRIHWMVNKFRKSTFLFQLSCLAVQVSSNSMQTIRRDGMGGRGVQFIPKSGQYSNLVVWMHGLGDTADGWASMMPQLKLENTKIVLPTANSRPIAINGGDAMPGLTLFCVPIVYVLYVIGY